MVNERAPHGYKGGRPYAPYGYKKNGLPRKVPSKKSGGRMRVYGRGDYKVGRPIVRGRGGYWADFTNAARPYTRGISTKIGSTIGGAAGATLGTLAFPAAPGISTIAGGALGAGLGAAAGKFWGNVSGFGDYRLRSNSFMNVGRPLIPTFGEDAIRVRKREVIAHIDATTAFQNNSFPLNPGLSDTFPWLSAIANNYEQYRFNGVIFQFRSTSSDAIASTTDLGLGQVILATNYNPQNPAFVNDLQMLNSMFANSGKPSEDILHAIECAPGDTPLKMYNVRSGDVPDGTDLSTYDLGTFQIATVNCPANYTGMGQLIVTYDVTFKKSVMNNQLGYDINTDKWTLGTVTDLAPFGTTSTEVSGSNLGTTIDVSGAILNFPPTIESGYYQINYYALASTTQVVALNLTGVNCTIIESAGNTGTNVNRTILNFIVRIDERDAYIQVTSATLGTFSGGIMYITQVNGELFV